MSVSAQRALRSAIDSRQFERVYYLHGDDEFRKDDALHQLIDAAVEPGMRDFNLDVHRGAEVDAQRLDVSLLSLPMLAARRVVVLRDVGALRKQARAQLDRYLDAPAEDTILVLTSVAGDKPDGDIERRSSSIAFSPLSTDQLASWLKQQATRGGTTLSDDAAALIAECVDGDLSHAAGELEKLFSYAHGRSIESADVEAIVGVRRGETVGDLLDAVAERNGRRAVSLVTGALAQPKVTGVNIVMALASMMIAMSWGRAAVDGGLSMSRLESEYFGMLRAGGAYPGRPWKEAAKCWAKNVSRWSAVDLARAVKRVCAADVSLKDTKISSDEAMIASLVLALCTPATRAAA